MMPGPGAKFPIDVTTGPKSEDMTNAYLELGLPVAPAVMVADDIVVEGQDVSRHEIEISTCPHLVLPETQPPQQGVFSRLLGKGKR